MKKSKIKNIQGSGTFKDFFVFEIEFHNNDIGNMYKKTKSSNLNIGQEVSYTINEKGTIKIQTLEQSLKDISIIRQSSLKAACVVAAAKIRKGENLSNDDVYNIARDFIKFINNG
tara:strand:+ start:3176 stop:3520 length:345 start_codon:yes stop_codon:yes gene_type:complete